MAWIAYILALMAFILMPGPNEMGDLKERIHKLEMQKCTMMVISTPSGTATICAIEMGRAPPQEKI
jgi:hypothetical protein